MGVQRWRKSKIYQQLVSRWFLWPKNLRKKSLSWLWGSSILLFFPILKRFTSDCCYYFWLGWAILLFHSNLSFNEVLWIGFQTNTNPSIAFGLPLCSRAWNKWCNSVNSKMLVCFVVKICRTSKRQIVHYLLEVPRVLFVQCLKQLTVLASDTIKMKISQPEHLTEFGDVKIYFLKTWRKLFPLRNWSLAHPKEKRDDDGQTLFLFSHPFLSHHQNFISF